MSPRYGVCLLASAVVLAGTACGHSRLSEGARPGASKPTGGAPNSSNTAASGRTTSAPASGLAGELTAVACRSYQADAHCEARNVMVSAADRNFALFSIALQFGPGGAPVGAAVIAHRTGGQWSIVWGPGTGGIGCFGPPIPAAVLAGWHLSCPTPAPK